MLGMLGCSTSVMGWSDPGTAQDEPGPDAGQAELDSPDGGDPAAADDPAPVELEITDIQAASGATIQSPLRACRWVHPVW